MMAEYIERQALIKAYVDLCLARSRLAKSRKGAVFFRGGLLPETELTDKEWMRLINATPTVDAVEVVRCEKCKHRTDETYDGNYLCMTKVIGVVRPNDYCSFGERREDDA